MATTQTVYEFMSKFDNENLEFEKWKTVLEDAVRVYNEENSTNFSPEHAFYNYCSMELKTKK